MSAIPLIYGIICYMMALERYHMNQVDRAIANVAGGILWILVAIYLKLPRRPTQR
jgi:hypothetical protein